MLHLEGQTSGFYSGGIDDDFVFSSTNGEHSQMPELAFPLGSYVQVKGRYGRIIDASAKSPQHYSVEFFNYADKQVKRYAESELRLSRRVSVVPDCEVLWRGQWYPAEVLREADGRWFIHYIDDDHSWDEWVGVNRIRFPSQ